jgi:hypothetical protein
MTENNEFDKHPRFYKKPSESEIESEGKLTAEIMARTRARIIGSRVLSAVAVTGIGTLLTVQDAVSGKDLKAADLVGNFAFPIIINTAVELRIEKQLRNMGQELIRLLPEIGKFVINGDIQSQDK